MKRAAKCMILSILGKDKKIKVAGYAHHLLKITLKRSEREREGWWGWIYSSVANVGPHGMFKGDAFLDDCVT